MFEYQKTHEILRVIGARIRAARLRSGDRQKDFAYRIGVTVPTLRSLEAGKPTVSAGALINAMEVLGRADDMLGVLSGVATEKQRARVAR